METPDRARAFFEAHRRQAEVWDGKNWFQQRRTTARRCSTEVSSLLADAKTALTEMERDTLTDAVRILATLANTAEVAQRHAKKHQAAWKLGIQERNASSALAKAERFALHTLDADELLDAAEDLLALDRADDALKRLVLGRPISSSLSTSDIETTRSAMKRSVTAATRQALLCALGEYCWLQGLGSNAFQPAELARWRAHRQLLRSAQSVPSLGDAP